MGNILKIHAIEPHPDDVLGSASGLCYIPEGTVTLHTIGRTADDRDLVVLDENITRKEKSMAPRATGG